MTITVTRDNDRDLSFQGERIGFGSSQRKDGEFSDTRWSELTIYRVYKGGYVAAGVGVSIRPGEVNKCWAYHAKDANTLIDLLYRIDKREGPRQGRRFLPWAARLALEDAAMEDDDIDEALVEDL